MPDHDIDSIERLACWNGAPRAQPLAGGITNRNFLVEDDAGKFVVRLGQDVPAHGIVRAHELAASRAAAACGVSPEVVFAQPGALVLRFIDGRTLSPADLRDTGRLPAVVALIKKCHRGIPGQLAGAPWDFNVFAVIRFYADQLRQRRSPHAARLDDILARADSLERAAPPSGRVFGHNDLLAGNFIDDGRRLWLIDWDYAGFNDPLFDLAGLASNNEFTPDLESALLSHYFGAGDGPLAGRFRAMKAASLLRETMWSMVSELTSNIEFDYAAYTRENVARFEAAWAAWQRG